jgi:hypothetical protein
MNEPEGTGSHEAEGAEEGIALPSWIDAAIAKSQGDDVPAELSQPPDELADLDQQPSLYHDTAEAPPDLQLLGGHEWMAEQQRAMDAEDLPPEPTAIEEAVIEHPPAAESNEPFPSFLGRTDALARETAIEPVSPDPDSVELEAWTEFDGEDPSMFVQHPRPETIPMPEPVPLPEAPTRHRGIAGPWLMAALFFAAAALVLAVLIWLRPLPR